MTTPGQRHQWGVVARRVVIALTRWIREYGLAAAGLACLTVAAALLHPAAGWAAGGAALLLLEWRVAPDDDGPGPNGGAR